MIEDHGCYGGTNRYIRQSKILFTELQLNQKRNLKFSIFAQQRTFLSYNCKQKKNTHIRLMKNSCFFELCCFGTFSTFQQNYLCYECNEFFTNNNKMMMKKGNTKNNIYEELIFLVKKASQAEIIQNFFVKIEKSKFFRK